MAGHRAMSLVILCRNRRVLVCVMIVGKILAVDRLAGERQITEQDGDDKRAAAGNHESP
jgi:hypothetical protein